VYPSRDEVTGALSMEGAYIDGRRIYRARIDGGLEQIARLPGRDHERKRLSDS
jgi:hypothetical protein